MNNFGPLLRVAVLMLIQSFWMALDRRRRIKPARNPIPRPALEEFWALNEVGESGAVRHGRDFEAWALQQRPL